MDKRIFFLLSILSLSIDSSAGSNILGITIAPFKSMNSFMTTIFQELANRGHNITVITAFPGKASHNYREIAVKKVDILELMEQNDYDKFASHFFMYSQTILWSVLYYMTEHVYKSPELQEFISNDNSKFDLVICEEFSHQANYIFAHKYQVPLVLVHTFGHSHYLNDFIGNPLELAYSTHEYLPYYGPMNIWQKTYNALLAIFDLTVGKKYVQYQNKIAEDNFKGMPRPLPRVEDLERNASIVFVNSHYTIDQSRPLTPNVIEVAGLQITPPKPLPRDFSDILNNSKHGAIYFSLGSIMKSTDLPKETVNMLLEYFSTLKETVLLKWENDELPGKPKNVFIRKWMPQNDILAHPNIKLFISHGGLQSLQEATYHGVPIIGLPLFADHFKNVAKATAMGYGEQITLDNLNIDTLTSTVNKIMSNYSAYKTTIENLSARFKDKPHTAMETCMFWIEYVIRHKGATFLKPPSVWMSWYEYYMVDVAVLLICAASLVSLIVYLCIKLISFIFCKTAARRSKSKRE